MTNSTKEQTQGIGQINEAIGHLESNTQQNVALVEEIAASTIQLRQQAERLVGALAVFASGNTEGRLLAAH
jgi:methyl-accepting chemotaxis protein